MSSEGKTILCGTHGQVGRAFACKHLTPDAVTPAGFLQPELDPDDPEPMAWCDECDAMFDREGDWTPALADFVNLKLVCEFCFDAIRRVHLVEQL